MPIPSPIIMTRDQGLIIKWLNHMGLIELAMRKLGPDHNTGAQVFRLSGATTMVINNYTGENPLTLIEIPESVASYEDAVDIFKKIITARYNPTNRKESDLSMEEAMAPRLAQANN